MARFEIEEHVIVFRGTEHPIRATPAALDRVMGMSKDVTQLEQTRELVKAFVPTLPEDADVLAILQIANYIAQVQKLAIGGLGVSPAARENDGPLALPTP